MSLSINIVVFKDRHNKISMDVDYVSEIELELKRAAQELYKNPRIKDVTFHANTLMGTSVTYTSRGDPESPLSKALQSKDIQYAIQNSERPACSNPAPAIARPRDIPGGIQQWMGPDA